MTSLLRCVSAAPRRPCRTAWVALLTIVVFAVSASSADSRSAEIDAKQGKPTIYLDLRAGDGGTAPDIVATTLENTTTGILKFDITFLNRSALGPDDIVTILIDADKNAKTGDEGGMDYALQARGTDIALARLLGSGGFELIDVPSLQGSWANGGQSLEVAASDLGGTESFWFYVHTFVVDGGDAFDDSPDGTGLWDYTLQTPDIQSLRTQFLPRTPRAGSHFRVSAVMAHLISAEDVQADSFTCSATLAGKGLKGTGAGGCSFSLRRAAKGKALRVVVRARFRDQTKAVAYALRVH
jgi:hypothetical protein